LGAILIENFKTYQLALTFYRECRATRVPRHLHDQLLRASSSIVLNIAEGYGRATVRETERFYAIALGSLRECTAILTLADKARPKNGTADQLGACLYVLAKIQTQTQTQGRKQRQGSDPGPGTAPGDHPDPKPSPDA